MPLFNRIINQKNKIVGTIDISYFNLFTGLLLLVIPFFYLWKFKTGLLKPAVIGTLRMIVQLFLIGMYLKYLFLWNSPWINFLWVIVMVFVAGQTALVRTRRKRSILLIPVSVGVFFCVLWSEESRGGGEGRS